MTGIALWIAEPTGCCRLVLRRFCFGDKNGHRHDASVILGEDEPATTPRGGGTKPVPDGWIAGQRVPHDDPRWPRACAGCGEPFGDSGEWQVNELEWYEGTGGRFCWGIGAWDGMPGAMIRSPWRDTEGRPPSWTVFLPNRTYWNTNDRPAGEGNQLGGWWDVTGEAPLITVHPSIDDRDPARPWHGWIRSGVLERC